MQLIETVSDGGDLALREDDVGSLGDHEPVTERPSLMALVCKSMGAGCADSTAIPFGYASCKVEMTTRLERNQN